MLKVRDGEHERQDISIFGMNDAFPVGEISQSCEDRLKVRIAVDEIEENSFPKILRVYYGSQPNPK